jgi:hypothetical protein
MGKTPMAAKKMDQIMHAEHVEASGPSGRCTSLGASQDRFKQDLFHFGGKGFFYTNRQHHE